MQQDSFFTTQGGDACADFRLLHESETGYCRLFELTTSASGRTIVFKTLKKEYADNSYYQRLLRREFEITSSLYHRGIVFAIEWRDHPTLGGGFTLERIGGVTLSAYLASANRSRRASRAIAYSLIDALAYVHSRGFVHRDLKPDNIMVDPNEGTVRLIDFGLSCKQGSDSVACGTEGYSAPEQLSGCTASPRADIYSLGKILEELTPSGLSLRRAARKCLTTDPQLRYADAEALRLSLRRQSRRLRLSTIAAASAAVIAAAVMLIPDMPELSPSATSTHPSPAASRSTSDARSDSLQMAAAPASADSLPMPAANQNLPMPPMAPGAIEASAAPETPPSQPLEEQLYEVSLAAAARAFDDHLRMLDTASTQHTVNLAYVEHWKWRAKQAVSGWLEGKVNDKSPYRSSLMQLASKAIDDYGEEHSAQDWAARRKQFRRNQLGGITKISERIPGTTRVRTTKLQQDGTYHISIVDEAAVRARKQLQSEE